MPTVSIIMASYNHEKYIQQAIESVLNQKYVDFELIIVDDASQDRSVEKIKRYQDKRIKLTTLTENKGQFVATNIGLAQAMGKYIAILNSDDAYDSHKLEKQVTYLESHPEIAAVFTNVNIIDENKGFFRKRHLYHSVFNQPNRTRHAWLHYFFYYGNGLCHPSVLIRREHHETLGCYDPRFANCADFLFWIKLLSKYSIHILPEKLTHFRVHSHDNNMSGNMHTSVKRMRWEDYQAKLLYFNSLINENEFLEVFPEAKKYIIDPNKKLIPNYLLARLALEHHDPYLEALGLRILFDMMHDKNTAQTLQENYHFTYKKLIELTGQANPFQIQKTYLSSLKKWINLATRNLLRTYS